VSVAAREAVQPGGPGIPSSSSFGGRLAVPATKLQPRYQRPGIVARPRLLERIRHASSPMVALIAPAGYGKSTVLSQLGEDSLAWLSADRRDGDPAVLVRDLAAAIDRVRPLASETIDAVMMPGPSVWLTAVPRLGAVLAAEPDMTLVIDDIDHIDEPEAVDVLMSLTEHIRGSARIILAGRSFGMVPAARLVSRGVLTTLERDDLALDAAETASVLAAAGVRTGIPQVQDLHQRTEGWAAGVYLSALSAEPHRLGEGLSFAAPARLVEEYLRTEVIGSLNADDAELLLAASVLDRMCGSLCDALLDRRRAGAALDRLERTNLFLIPLDRERTWYRFHHLLGDFLRAELERHDPDLALDLRRRAGAWHEANGEPEAALEYAMAGGDEARAARLTLLLGQTALNAGRSETVRRWFGWFDEREAGRRMPRLAAYAAFVFAFEGDAARAERWADATSAVPDDTIHGPDLGVVAVNRVLLARGGVDQMLVDAQLAVDSIPDSDTFRIAALTALGVARQVAGDVDGAERALTEAVARWDVTRSAHAAVCMSLVQLAASALERGDRQMAGAHVHKARGIVTANDLGEHIITVGIDALDARIAMAHGAVEQARADLAHSQRVRPRLGHATPWLALRARFDLVRVHLALGDGGGARTLMAEVKDILTLRPEMGSLLAERDELVDRLAAVRGGQAGASTLTMAELRVLPLLTTHLTFREIGERLFVSQNTVKTQAISIYRKLEATSRSEAIDRAVTLGLIESSGQTEHFIPAG
jgi:LuxR family maltose regulon positive regulatory protein